MNPRHFGGATRDGGAIWFTVDAAAQFGIVVGPRATPLSTWTACLVMGATLESHQTSLERRGQWDFYTRQCTPETEDVAIDLNDDEVGALLAEHAPQSSTWPGDANVVAWYGLRDEHRLVAVAALTKWQSGHHVVSSVATATDYRGRGLARRLMVGVVGAAHARGVEWLGLGVARSNDVAQRVYRDVGFVERARFTRYGQPEN